MSKHLISNLCSLHALKNQINLLACTPIARDIVCPYTLRTYRIRQPADTAVSNWCVYIDLRRTRGLKQQSRSAMHERLRDIVKYTLSLSYPYFSKWGLSTCCSKELVLLSGKESRSMEIWLSHQCTLFTICQLIFRKHLSLHSGRQNLDCSHCEECRVRAK